MESYESYGTKLQSAQGGMKRIILILHGGMRREHRVFGSRSKLKISGLQIREKVYMGRSCHMPNRYNKLKTRGTERTDRELGG